MTTTPTPFTTPDADASWAGEFLRETLDHWLAASVRRNGLFHPDLDRQWRPVGEGARTLVSQCRLIYNFSRGYEVFGDARFAGAAAQGLTALHAYFHIAPGLYRWSVQADGAEADPTPDAYGHAFCLLAHATAARALGEAAFAARAAEVWTAVTATFTDRHGGLLWRLTGPDAWDGSQRSQNPMMHMFEALMAFQALDAARIGLGFLQTRRDFGAGRLVERFTPDWQPLPGDAGGVVDLGHAFEWAWLLSEWHRLTGEAQALEVGARFLDTGLTYALDSDGGVFASCGPDGQVVSRATGLWQQCEAVRALRRYAVVHGRSDLQAPLQRALSFYRSRFVDAQYGGVFAEADGTAPHKGDVWKLDYHTLGLCLELMGRG